MVTYEPRWREPDESPGRRERRETARAALVTMLAIALLAPLTIFIAPIFYAAPLAALPRALRVG